MNTEKPSRADYHREHQARAEAEAQRLLARKAELQGRWLPWVAQELYQLSPPEFVNMVRRELPVGVARMQSGDCLKYAKAVAAKAPPTSLPHLWEGL